MPLADTEPGSLSTIFYVFDGGGVALTSGKQGDIQVPFPCTIVSATLLADRTGSIVVDVWKAPIGSFPPTDANAITASAVPAITGGVDYTDPALTGWTTAINANDVLRFNIDSAATVQRATIQLTVRK